MLHTPIVCRSPADIRDDTVTDAHTSITNALNKTCNGRCLCTGKAREALVSLRAQCEAFILGEGDYPTGIHARILWAQRLQQ